jgi:hypothetical protein
MLFPCRSAKLSDVLFSWLSLYSGEIKNSVVAVLEDILFYRRFYVPQVPKMKSVTSLVAMQKKDLTLKHVTVFHIIFPIYTLTSLNVYGHVF